MPICKGLNLETEGGHEDYVEALSTVARHGETGRILRRPRCPGCLKSWDSRRADGGPQPRSPGLRSGEGSRT